MKAIQRAVRLIGFLAIPVVTLTGCDVTIAEGQANGSAAVDVRTPAGGMSVRTDVNAGDTGLPVYPGARVVQGRDRDESANVEIGNAWFGVSVVAARLESDDQPQRILDFYRNELRTYGTVVECRGELDFRGRDMTPSCRERRRAQEVHLLAGTRDAHRIVVVEPRGDGAEFSLVRVETRGN